MPPPPLRNHAQPIETVYITVNMIFLLYNLTPIPCRFVIFSRRDCVTGGPLTNSWRKWPFTCIYYVHRQKGKKKGAGYKLLLGVLGTFAFTYIQKGWDLSRQLHANYIQTIFFFFFSLREQKSLGRNRRIETTRHIIAATIIFLLWGGRKKEEEEILKNPWESNLKKKKWRGQNRLHNHPAFLQQLVLRHVGFIQDGNIL